MQNHIMSRNSLLIKQKVKIMHPCLYLYFMYRERERERELDIFVVIAGLFGLIRSRSCPGMDKWKRKQMHSHIYRVPEPFRNEVMQK